MTNIDNSGSGARIAGRDFHEHHHNDADVIDPWFRELQHRFATHANDKSCMHCNHCGLRGQPPNTDDCRYCGNDVGVARRAREAKLARERRIRNLMADGRRVCCYIATLALLSMVYDWAHGLPEHGVGAVLSYATAAVLFTIMVGEMMVYGWICVEVWIDTHLPPWLHRHGLGWLTGAV